jgi:Zn-dependent peptidase ImmA (M78 family)
MPWNASTSDKVPRKVNLEDIRASIDSALRNLAKQQGSLVIPIDLAEVCRVIGVEWEFRWMIPEGVTAIVDDKLKIFIRSNFSGEQLSEKRQRFTWAHEICHALLYDLSSKPPKPIEDSPNDRVLESLCQNGAGYLLMPPAEIKRLFNLSRPVASVDDVVLLSNRFGASYEVVIRRLKQESDCLRSDYALVLLRRRDGEDEIIASAHDIWLRTLLPEPTRGQAFAEWARSFLNESQQTRPDEWENGRTKVRIAPISRFLAIAEFRQA